MLFYASVIINGCRSEGQYTKSLLVKLFKMGAEVTVNVGDDWLMLEQDDNFQFFKNYK